MARIKLMYKQAYCPCVGGYADCPYLYNSDLYELDDGVKCGNAIERDYICMWYARASSVYDHTRIVTEERSLKNFKAYIEDSMGNYFGVLETSRRTRPCDYLEVDGKVIFDNLESSSEE